MAYGDIKDNITPGESFTFQIGHVEKVFGSESEYQSLKRSKAGTGLIQFTPDDSNSNQKTIQTAIPLLRGISDSVTRGDLIMFTIIGGKTFYLGPINTRNNPSNSSDHLYEESGGLLSFAVDKADRPDGYNINIPDVSVPKLAKPRFNVLDFPGQLDEINPTSDEYLDSNFTDLILEGRYGNAIRVGARNQFPQLIISNNNTRNMETLGGGGSIFAMTSLGKIEDNFPLDRGFRLSCDFGDNIIPERDPRSTRMSSGNDKTAEDHTSQHLFNYRYGEVQPLDEEQLEFDQVIISSDRIIFNTTHEDLTLSANRNINIGAGGNLTLANKGYSVFESRNIYIGNRAKDRSQPMVLGEELRRLLVRILRVLADAHALGDYNVPQPLSILPNMVAAGSLKAEVNAIMKEFGLGSLVPGNSNIQSPDPSYQPNVEDGIPQGDSATGGAKFFSKHHFIETNRE